jgi:hypothetical protein
MDKIKSLYMKKIESSLKIISLYFYKINKLDSISTPLLFIVFQSRQNRQNRLDFDPLLSLFYFFD